MFIRSLAILLWAFTPSLLSGAETDCVQAYFGTNGNPGGVRQIIGGREGVAFLRTNRGWAELRRNWQRAMGPWDPEIPGPLDAESLAGLRVLDAGTGEGALVEDLRAVGIDAVGIDLALSPTQKEKPYFFAGDMRSTGFAANEFDFIISAYTVFHYGDPLQPDMQKDSLTELSRILKPGGKLLIIGLTQGMELVSERSGSFNLKLVEPRGMVFTKYSRHSEFLLEKF